MRLNTRTGTPGPFPQRTMRTLHPYAAHPHAPYDEDQSAPLTLLLLQGVLMIVLTVALYAYAASL